MEQDDTDRLEEDAKESDRQTRGLAGIAVILFLALIASYLIQDLRREGQIEDCLMAQGLNCDALINQR